MSEIRIRENESLESALRRFKRQCARAGVIAEVRKREHYEKPSVRRKKKAEAARMAAEKAAAVREYNAKHGVVEEESPKNEALSGIAERPYCKGRAYDPNRYNR